MKNSNKNAILLTVIIFLTNISQLPFLVENEMTRFFSFPGWIIIFVVLFFENKIKFEKQVIRIVIIGFLFMGGTLIAELITSHNHLSSNLIDPFYLSLFIFLIGLFSSDSFEGKNMLRMIYSYISSIFIVSVNIFVDVFSKGYDWLAVGYAYGSKNSISQMIFTAFILLMFLYRPKLKIKKILKYGLLIFWIILLLALKSRATILSFALIPFVIITYSKINIKWKILTISLLMVIGLLFVMNPYLKEVIIDGVLLGGRRNTSLNEISSGRIDQFTIFFPMWFKGNELFGTGTLYVESFPLNALLKHGILVGWLLILVALWPLKWSIKNLERNNLSIAFLIISASYTLNSLFEAQGPYGPGTKNYILWLLFGFIYGIQRTSKKKNITNNEMNTKIS